MFVRPWAHLKPSTIPFGLRWLGHHLFGNCFAFLFKFPPERKTMLYFGNLTDDVKYLDDIESVDVLALPYCPANNKWKRHTQVLINRFSPKVTLIHHFDNFMHPYTLSKYLNLVDYRSAILNVCPDANIVFSKFFKEVTFDSILNSFNE